MRKILDLSAKLNFALIAVLSFGIFLRVWGIDFGLPHTTAPDEPTHFKIALGIFKTGDLNPHWLNYPSLMFYLNALALVPYYFVGKIAGVFASPSDVPVPEVVTMGVGLLSVPSEFLYSRLLTAAFAVASIGLIYVVARQMRLPRWGAVLAALLLAVSPAAVYNSHLIRPDTFATFFGLLSVFWALKILDDPKPWNYVWSGICAGFAVSSKYNMPLIVLPMITAHFLRYGFEGFKRKRLYLGIIVSTLAFLATTPYIALDFPLFIRGFGYEVTAQAEGHVGVEGNTFPWYLSFLWSTEGLLVVAALMQAVRLVWTRSKEGIVLLSFPLIYFIFINLFIVRNDRTILPMLPFLHVLAAMFTVGLYDWLTQSRRALAVPGALAACLMLVFFPLRTSIAWDTRLTQPDGRDTARAWIESNLPSGTRLAQEAYTPYVDSRRYVVQGVYGIIDNSPDWYVRNGFEYLILSQGIYGRFFAEPDRYGEWTIKYNQFFNRFTEIKRFNENDYEIRIYKTETVLPAHRVAARFGDEGDLIELVGYDATSRWSANEPLRVKLFWRALSAKREPLEIEMVLRSQNDRALSRVRGDLFQGKGWQPGIFSSEWAIPFPTGTIPGEHRIEINVVQTRFSYSTPALTWREEKLDEVSLGPFILEAVQ